MKKIEVVKSSDEFNTIINKGKVKKNNAFNIFVFKNSEHSVFPKFGIAVSKKNANAVYRNKNKRQIRNIVDKNKKDFKNDYKYIIMVKRDGIKMSFEEKEKKLIELIGEINE